jgi:predicted RNase H-like HicB family nuclease
MNPFKYSVVIQWSEEDQCYIATLPEWGNKHTHGATYMEAAQNAEEVLELLMDGEESLPEPHLFVYPEEPGAVEEPQATQTGMMILC